MQKIMQTMNKDSSIPQKILEINQDHNLMRNLLKVYKSNPADEYIINVAEQLYESSLLLEGYLTDPHKLVNRINDLLNKSSDWYTKLKEM
jgi:molecular chaperone HtpG